MATDQTLDKPDRPCPTLVLGLGNVLLRDEGVGVRVVEAMGQVELPSDVELFDGATAGFDLIEVLADRQRVIVVDAVDGPGEPGTVLRLGPEDLVPRDGRGLSLHEVGLLEALALVEQLSTAPREVVIYGVQPEQVTWGLSLSPRIARLVPKVVELVLAELGRGNSDADGVSRTGGEGAGRYMGLLDACSARGKKED